MKGLFVTNDSLKTKKYTELEDRIFSSAKKLGVELVGKTNAEFACFDSFSDYSFALFWDKDTRLALELERNGLRLFNSAKAIALCDDKWLTRIELLKADIPMPKSIIVPLVWQNYDFRKSIFIDGAETKLGYPMVAKHCFGSFGAQVYLVKNRAELLDVIDKACSQPVMLEKYIAESCGKDIRIEVVGGKAVAATMRTNPNDFRANVTNGGTMTKYQPTEREIELAERAAKVLQLDFCGVDLLFSNEGALVCEVNSNAHFVNLQNCTHIDLAQLILKHIVEVMENQ